MSALATSLQQRFDEIKALGLTIDMTRGKPCSEQLDLSNDMLNGVGSNGYKTRNGTDTRNYGGMAGIDEARELMGGLIGVEPANTIAFGNSSLTIMYHYLMAALYPTIETLKAAGKTARFLAPSPGYDRHFWICEKLGLEMLLVPFTAEGPDVAVCRQLMAEHDNVMGIWCVPKHSNPTGHTYSDAVVDGISQLPKLAKGPFVVMWDNAYGVHELSDTAAPLANMREISKANGTEDGVAIFGSTSKITLAGAGIGAAGLSTVNFKMFEKYLGVQSIGPDKINQLVHAKFFSGGRTVASHMKRHAAILKPKFDAVLAGLESELGGMANVSWTKPEGGYFISLYAIPGTAGAVVAMAKELGVALTPAGAAFPKGKDARDTHIRIAPSCPALEEIATACEVITLCVKLAAKRPTT